MEEEKEDKHGTKPIRYSFYGRVSPGYDNRFTFNLKENREKFEKMLLVFKEKKIVKYHYRTYQDDYLDVWERDEYDDSYGAWERNGGPDRDIADYDGAFDPYDGGDFY